ncbi:hypothetical protein OOK31_35855 [Streptomyces sp. NBC_00249]|uniref:hypothetical protein n=1 Tax=Streptomyces sp. NBC_00249 TaxID=2975690 RepID=UPI00224FF3D4|nr:hypothetical protein [Streptomyces sp. NBC_00249]MCX5199197.1 hypothetical protein [Streptomyces sp. NBC_00249]
MSAAFFRRSAWAAAAVLALATLSSCSGESTCKMPKGVTICLTAAEVKNLDTVHAAGQALLDSPGVTSELLFTPPKGMDGSVPGPLPGTGRYRGDGAEAAVGGSYEMQFTEDGHTDSARYAGGQTYVRYWRAVDQTGKPAWVAMSQGQLAKTADEMGTVAWRARAANPLMTARLLAAFTPGALDSFTSSGADGREFHVVMNSMSMSAAGNSMLTSAFPDHSPNEVTVDLRLDEQKRITWFEVTMKLTHIGGSGAQIRVMHTFKPADAPVTLGPPEGLLNPPKAAPTGS